MVTYGQRLPYFHYEGTWTRGQSIENIIFYHNDDNLKKLKFRDVCEPNWSSWISIKSGIFSFPL